MKIDEFNELLIRLSQLMHDLEDIETVLIDRFGERCYSAVWMRMTGTYLVLSSLHLSEEFKKRFGGNENGWSIID